MEPSTHSLHAPRFIIAAFAILIVAGCASALEERRLIAPDDPQAQTCVANCDFAKAQCEQRQRVREQECRDHFDSLTSDLDACLATPGALCVRPDVCPGADMTVCRIQYEECIVACGGSVETRFSLSGKPSD
jgi:hypothetical protein